MITIYCELSVCSAFLMCDFFNSIVYRDGMIKRPGNESYLGKMIEEERRAFSEVLEVSSSVGSPPQTESDSDSA